MPSHRQVSLDLLRAVAILLVMGCHMNVCPPQQSQWLFEVTNFLQRGGWVGVDLFFVLSGYLIGGLLFQEHQATGEIRYGRFLLRRGLKIYPLFWVALAAVATLRWLIQLPLSRAAVWADLLFASSYTQGLLGVSWSLAVEEHFYLLLPLLLLALARGASSRERAFARLPWAIAAVAVGSMLIRVLTYDPTAFEIHRDFMATHLRLDGLCFGVLLAYFRHYHSGAFANWSLRNRSRLLVYGLLGFLPSFLLPLSGYYVRVPGFAVNWLAAGALLCAALTWQPQPHWGWRLLGRLGRQSYATYLFHYAIGTSVVPLVFIHSGWTLTWPRYWALYFGLSLAVGAVLTWAVEQPLLAWRDRRVPPGGARPDGASSPAEAGSGRAPFALPHESPLATLAPPG